MTQIEVGITDVNKLKEGLKQLPEPVANPVLVAVCGLPGTGKSHFCRKLSERLPSIILESDVLRKELFGSPHYSLQESKRLFSACHCLIVQLLSSGINVILDATNLMEQHRERLYNIAERVNVKLVMIQVVAPPSVVRGRLQNRMEKTDFEDNSNADWEVYQRMMAKVEKIRRNYFMVNTSEDINPMIDKVVREVRK